MLASFPIFLPDASATEITLRSNLNSIPSQAIHQIFKVWGLRVIGRMVAQGKVG